MRPKLDEDTAHDDAVVRELDERSDSPLPCAHCGSVAVLECRDASRFQWRVTCLNILCGVSTGWLAMRGMPVKIWNRRVVRRPPRLLDAQAPVAYTQPSNARERGGGKAAGSQRNRPKRMRRKTRSLK